MIEVWDKPKWQKQIAIFFKYDLTNVNITSDIDSTYYEIQLSKVSIV